jgi:hypothetical protein
MLQMSTYKKWNTHCRITCMFEGTTCELHVPDCRRFIRALKNRNTTGTPLCPPIKHARALRATLMMMMMMFRCLLRRNPPEPIVLVHYGPWHFFFAIFLEMVISSGRSEPTLQKQCLADTADTCGYRSCSCSRRPDRADT